MSKIRVLIVDDSVAIRGLLTKILSEDPGLEVVGSAANGKVALDKIGQCLPDVVTMDIEMPEMDGLTAVSEIRKIHADLPIIMCSNLSQRAARETLEALSRGANDYVTKSVKIGGPTLARQWVHDELVVKIKAFCPQKLSVIGSSEQPPVRASVAPMTTPHPTGVTHQGVEIVSLECQRVALRPLVRFSHSCRLPFPFLS